MQLARYEANAKRASYSDLSHLSVRAALKLIAGPPKAKVTPLPSKSAAQPTNEVGPKTRSTRHDLMEVWLNTPAEDRLMFAECLGQKIIRDFQLRKIGRVISKYAQQRVQEVTPMVTAERLLEERVAKSRDTQRMISEAIHKYQAEHPGVSRQNAIDAVLFGPQVREILKLERQLDEMAKLGGGNLPTPRPGAMHRTHNDSAPVRGRTGYDSSVDGRPPHNPDASEEPTIHDHNEMLTQIRSGQIPFSDPRVSALVRLERKAKFGS